MANKMLVPAGALRLVTTSNGIYVTGDVSLHSGSLKGRTWVDLRMLDEELSAHAQNVAGSELRPDYGRLPFNYLSPGSHNDFMWFEIKDGKHWLYIGPFDECPFMQSVDEGKQVLVPANWVGGVEMVVKEQSVRAFINPTTVHLFDGRVTGYNPETAQVTDKLDCAA